MQALRVWRYGPSTRLREHSNRDSRVRVFRLGQGSDSDIRVTPDPTFEDGPEIGNVHCTIVCTPERVTVCDIAAAGPTWVNDICVVHGEVEVRPGNVITVGTVQLVVCGDDPNQQPDITAPDIPTLIAKTKQMYSAPSHQAAALKVPKSTYFHWLATGRFMAAAVLCLGLGGFVWIQFGTQGSAQQRRPASVSAATTAAATSKTMQATEPAKSNSAPTQSALPASQADVSNELSVEKKARRKRVRKPVKALRTSERRSETAQPEKEPGNEGASYDAVWRFPGASWDLLESRTEDNEP